MRTWTLTLVLSVVLGLSLPLCCTAVFEGYDLPAETEKLLKATKKEWLLPKLNKAGVNHHFKKRQIGAFVIVHSQKKDIDYVLCVKQTPMEGKGDNHARIELQKLHGTQVCFASGRGRAYSHLEHLIGDAVASSMAYFRIPMCLPAEPATIVSALETINMRGPEAISLARQRQGEQGANNVQRDRPQAPAPALDVDHTRAAAALAREKQQRVELVAGLRSNIDTALQMHGADAINLLASTLAQARDVTPWEEDGAGDLASDIKAWETMLLAHQKTAAARKKATAENTAAAVKIQTCIRGASNVGGPAEFGRNTRHQLLLLRPAASRCCCFTAQPRVPCVSNATRGAQARTFHDVSDTYCHIFFSSFCFYFSFAFALCPQGFWPAGACSTFSRPERHSRL